MIDYSILDDNEPDGDNIDRIKEAVVECLNDTLDEGFSFADVVYALCELLVDGPAGNDDPAWHAFVQSTIIETILRNRTSEDEVTLQ